MAFAQLLGTLSWVEIVTEQLASHKASNFTSLREMLPYTLRISRTEEYSMLRRKSVLVTFEGVYFRANSGIYLKVRMSFLLKRERWKLIK
ncbi:MAG: hypothetical protein AAGJ80_17060, partial [Cyanobacteria bacterium J06553_1]